MSDQVDRSAVYDGIVAATKELDTIAVRVDRAAPEMLADRIRQVEQMLAAIRTTTGSCVASTYVTMRNRVVIVGMAHADVVRVLREAEDDELVDLGLSFRREMREGSLTFADSVIVPDGDFSVRPSRVDSVSEVV